MNSKFARLTLSATFLFLLSLSASPALALKKALVIIDMQDVFVTRGGAEDARNNPEILARLAEMQIQMIETAKRKGMPILVVEYEGMGSTNQKLLEALEGYQPLAFVKKNTDGLFNHYNRNVQLAKSTLEAWGVRELVIMGANGGACVRQTVEGALVTGYRVWSYKKGIADFNYDDFIYPYSYAKPVNAGPIHNESLSEFDESRQVINFRRMPRREKPQ